MMTRLVNTKCSMMLKYSLFEREQKTKLNLVAEKRLVNKCNCLSTAMNGILFIFFFLFLVADFYCVYIYENLPQCSFILSRSYGSSVEATRLTTAEAMHFTFISSPTRWDALEKFIFAHTFVLITRRFLFLTSHFIYSLSLSTCMQSSEREWERARARRCMSK